MKYCQSFYVWFTKSCLFWKRIILKSTVRKMLRQYLRTSTRLVGPTSCSISSSSTASSRSFSTEFGETGDEALMVRWKKAKQCPECGKRVETNAVERMSDACGTMWRRKVGLSHHRCPNWSNAYYATFNPEDAAQHETRVPSAAWKQFPKSACGSH